MLLTPTPEQQKVIDLALDGHDLKINAFAGASKSQPLICGVQTPNGLKTIGSMGIGTELFRKDGSIGRVVGVYPQGVKKTYKVTFRDGSYTYCNDDHLWTVEDKASRINDWKTVNLAEIIDVGIRYPSGSYRWKIPMCDAVQYEEKNLPIHPYVLGFLLGDGYLHGNTPAVSFGHKDIQAKEYFKDYLECGLNLNCRLTSDNCDQCTITPNAGNKAGSNWFKNILGDLGLLVRGSDKHIPNIYLEGSVEQRKMLLKGLMDSDGSCSKNRTKFANKSKNLIVGIKTLVQSLGGTVIQTSTSKSGVHNLNIKVKENPFLIDVKANKWSYSSKNPPSRYITDIEFVGEDEQVCIKVDSDDSLYLTDDFIVTHNTTTLTMIANAKHEEGGNVGMYLAFNKVTALEAEGRFPNSVESRTVHSLAYRHTPKNLIAKLGYQRIFPTEIGELYKVNGTFISDGAGVEKYISIGNKVSMMNRTLTRFCNSADDEVGEKHLVKMDWMYTPIGENFDLNGIMGEVLDMARKHWVQTINPNSIVPMTHEAYLKLYSMSGRKIIADYIMIDENQDSSPVILKIVESQKKAQKIYVGDRYQSIYGWRGAINAMDIVTGEDVYLTKSFRFGNNIEKLANMILKLAGNDVPLLGNGNGDHSTYVNTMPMHPDVVICRTNAGVIKNIFDLSDQYQDLTIGASCDLREIEKFVFAYNDLMVGKKVEHQLLFAFNTIQELRNYCEENQEDMEITGLVNLIDKFTPKGLLSAIKRCEAVKKPDIMITTAHKSKGLEWDNVQIFNDFFYDVTDDRLSIDKEELNLLYVACTRAKKNIDVGGISDLMYYMLGIMGDKDEMVKLGFIPDESEYDGDEAAAASGGVIKGIPIEVSMMHIAGGMGVNVEEAFKKHIDKTCSETNRLIAENQYDELQLTNFGVEV